MLNHFEVNGTKINHHGRIKSALEMKPESLILVTDLISDISVCNIWKAWLRAHDRFFLERTILLPIKRAHDTLYNL